MIIIKYILYTLTCIALIPIFAFVWFYWGPGKDDIPETVGTVEVSTLKSFKESDKPLEESTHIVEINYFNNKNQNGAELFEINFTSYMGNDTAKKFSKGIQVYSNEELMFRYKDLRTDETLGFLGAILESVTWREIYTNQLVTYYDTSYETATEESFSISNSIGLSQDGSFIISVGDTPAKMQFKYEERLEANKAEYSKTIFGSEFIDYYVIDEMFFLYHMLENTKSLNEGTHFVTLDVSPYFNISLYDEEAKQFTKLTADTQFTFLTAKININNDGCNTKSQSLFGMIAGNDDSKYNENTQTALFWKTLANINLTENQFEIRESTKYGKLLTLKSDIRDRLNEFDDLRIKIVINADNCDGLDTYCFDGFENSIYSIEVFASEQKSFYVLDDSSLDLNVSNVEVLYA